MKTRRSALAAVPGIGLPPVMATPIIVSDQTSVRVLDAANALTTAEQLPARREVEEAFPEADAAPDAIDAIAPRLGLWTGGRPTIVSGLPDSMKTWVCCELALGVASAADHAFGGAVAVKWCGPIVHLDYENPGARRTMQRYRRLGRRDACLEVLAPRISLVEDGAEELLVRKLDRAPALCIVDSLQFGCRQRADTYSATLAMLGRVSERTGVPFIVIVHNVKGRGREGLDRLDFVRGYECDTALWVAKCAYGIATITSLKNSNGPLPIDPLRVRLVDEGDIDEATGVSARVRFEAIDAEASTRTASTVASDLRRRLVARLQSSPATYTTLRGLIRARNTRVRDELEAMVTDGTVEMTGGVYRLKGAH